MICLVCKSTSFYEDSESTLCCRDCGFQSQDYIPESNDVQDGIFGSTKAERLTFITKKSSRYKRKASKQKGATLFEFLLCYQKCLIDITKSIPHQTYSFVKYVQYLWSEYLILWMNSSYPILDCVSRHPNCNYDFLSESSNRKRESAANKHPLAPSLPLLLGFIYLACRQQRLPILVQDIVRLIYDGVIPYNNLWHNAKSLSAKWRRKVFSKRAFKLPSASNIIFHFNCLSNSLNITVAPLNGPLMIRSMIIDMALPPSVWHSYCKLFQILKDNDVFPRVDSYHQQHSEHIFVQLIMACKFCKNWLNWKLFKTVNKACNYKPQTLYELCDYKRQELEVLLQNLRRNQQGKIDDHNLSNFNDVIKNCLALDWNKDLLDGCLFSNEVTSNELFHTNSFMFGGYFNEYKYSKSHELDGPSSTLNSQYFIYSRDDLSGVYSPNLVSMVERLAKYTCTKSGLIFEILNSVEQEILDFIYSRHYVTEDATTAENAVNIDASFGAKLEKLKVLQIKQNTMLPAIKSFGFDMSPDILIDAFVDEFRPGEFEAIEKDGCYGLRSEKNILQGKMFTETDVDGTMSRGRSTKMSSSYRKNNNIKQKYLLYLNTPPKL